VDIVGLTRHLDLDCESFASLAPEFLTQAARVLFSLNIYLRGVSPISVEKRLPLTYAYKKSAELPLSKLYPRGSPQPGIQWPDQRNMERDLQGIAWILGHYGRLCGWEILEDAYLGLREKFGKQDVQNAIHAFHSFETLLRAYHSLNAPPETV
jgi:hypothetical protein